jgi:anthranilate phosphoribosyltransferase
VISTKTDWLLSAPPSATTLKANTPLHPFIVRLMRGEHLAISEAEEFFEALTQEDANFEQIAAALTALAMKGETFEELAGMASVMRKQAARISAGHKDLIDTTGTGSSVAKTFNVSTAAALVVAGAGLPVAKHGSRGVSSNTGSADLLQALGVKVSCEPSVAQKCFTGIGLCFMFAPKFHPHLQRIATVRRSLGIRTTLNLLGPLANPAGATKQIVGVWHPSLIEPMAQALSLLGTEHSWVVHGADGLDELTIAGESYVAEVIGNKVRKFAVAPETFRLREGRTDHLHVRTPEESAHIVREVFASRRKDEARTLIVINAAAAIYIGGIARDFVHAARLAEQSIDSGQAQNKLERLAHATNG